MTFGEHAHERGGDLVGLAADDPFDVAQYEVELVTEPVGMFVGDAHRGGAFDRDGRVGGWAGVTVGGWCNGHGGTAPDHGGGAFRWFDSRDPTVVQNSPAWP